VNRQEINQVQTYMQRVFGNDGITLTVPKKPNDPVEVWLGKEFLGTLYKDTDEGEVSYDFNMTILDVDLPSR